MAGRLASVSICRGEFGTAVPQSAFSYVTRTAGGVATAQTAYSTVYRNADGTGAETTGYSYTWQGGTARPATVTVTAPTVSTGRNGSGTATTGAVSLDSRGRVAWSKDAAGFLAYAEYDNATGAVVKSIADVDTAQTTTFSGLPSGWSTPSGGGLHVTSTAEVDVYGRPTKETDPNGNVSYAVYNDAGHEVRVYAGWDDATDKPAGPTLVTRENRALGYAETLTMSATPAVDAGGVPTGTEAVSNIQSLSRTSVNAAGQAVSQDVYHSLSGVTYSAAAATLGTLDSHYGRVTAAYDARGRQDRYVSATGTAYRTVYDGLGRPASNWVGTDDVPTSGAWSPSNLTGTNTVQVSAAQFDGGGVGDGNPTRLTEKPGGSEADRVTLLAYDWRNRPVWGKSGAEATESTSVNRPVAYAEYDNLGRVVASETYDGDTVSVADANGDGVPDRPSSGLLRARQTASYDELGRAYRSDTYSVDPSTGSVSAASLSGRVWFDARGLAVRQAAPGGLVQKAAYDGLGRPTTTYTSDGGGDTGYADADDVTGDTVLEQTEAQYDANGNVLRTATRQRFHDATGTGALGTPSSGIGARVYYAGAYYDALDRVTATADVGTNGGSAWTRPATVPARSDAALVTGVAYDAAGRSGDVTDPMGRVHRALYDLAGRVTAQVQNLVDGTPGGESDKTVAYAYDSSGNVTSLKAYLSATAYQETGYVYGVTAAQGSSVTSNDLLYATRHPDGSTGVASASEQETVTVSALGQTRTATDRNGSTHTYSYDVLGRLTADAVTTLGGGVDGAVRRIEVGYDAQGNAATLTQYSAATGGSVVNQVRREYDGLGQLTREWQEHAGAVTGTSKSVQYAYAAIGAGANQTRPTSVTYASGYALNLTYGTGGGLNDRVSRLAALTDSTGTLEAYSYLGLATVVTRAHAQPGLDWTLLKQGAEADGAGGDQYAGLDALGRLADQRWRDTDAGTDVSRQRHGYDRAGNRLYREDLVSAAQSEAYQYDGLDQLTGMQRGTLNAGKTGVTGTPARSQAWGLDALGNFDSVTSDGGTAVTRTHNRLNEVTALGAATPVYDSNGNLLTDEAGQQYVYDAWNRLVRVKDGAGATVAEYGYDGLFRRVTESSGGATRHLVYSDQWQVLEEYAGSATTPDVRDVWSPVYVDALVLRQRDANADGAMDERLWAVQDGNWNVVALADDAGNVVERFAYDAFGRATALTAGWTPRAGGASAYGWRVKWQGLREDLATGLYHARFREVSPTMGRPLQRDPLGFGAGDANVYRWERNATQITVDPFGLKDVTVGWRHDEGTATMNVAIDFEFVEGDPVKDKATPWTPARQLQFQSHFIKTVEDTFNKNDFVILGRDRRVGREFKFAPKLKLTPVGGRRRPDVVIRATSGTDKADGLVNSTNTLEGVIPVIRLLEDCFGVQGVPNVPFVGPPQPNVIPPGGYLFEPSAHYPYATGFYAPIYAAHEFGHAIGLLHPGQDLPRGIRPERDSPQDYTADAIGLMGLGHRLRPQYFLPWIDLIKTPSTREMPNPFSEFYDKWRIERH